MDRVMYVEDPHCGVKKEHEKNNYKQDYSGFGMCSPMKNGRCVYVKEHSTNCELRTAAFFLR